MPQTAKSNGKNMGPTGKVILASFLVGAIATTVYLATATDGPATDIASCPVRLDASGLSKTQSLGLKKYSTISFPVSRSTLPDGSIEILVPEVFSSNGKNELNVTDWKACDFQPCSSNQALCDKWTGFALDKTVVPATSKFVIPDCKIPSTAETQKFFPELVGKWDDILGQHLTRYGAVLPDCLAIGEYGLPDGGPRWNGCNVLPASKAIGTQCLSSPSDMTSAGERIEDNL